MIERQVCSYCFNWIEGGMYIDKDKRYFFCSNKCWEEWEKER